VRSVAAALIASLAAGAAAASPAAPAAQAPPKTVSSLTVTPNDPPALASSFPAAGQVIAPGVLVMKLAFDQKMLAGGFEIAAAPGSAMPDCLKTPRLLNDGKTFVLLCTTAPETHYAVALNAGSSGGFRNEGEIRAQAATLAFSTSDADGPTDLAAAMKVAGLGAGDMPIETAPLVAQAAPAR
jgi:hypothetical protein